ncbi:indoleamine 2,3-dioxygenase 2 [Ornithorhynchus anatinus]|uniref:Indoleamine 2,3-dioxygenase 2 n=1 Tax=Ornithorhynchus anatinus TaxID=9258 RepID=B3Y9H7_ORNAN|nr:indoleamine 2,3-dioxygenase 2 [Ornithorhynchus anatinus]BAG68603.1 indoleamine 2,3-dioxygenase 2 [Ornithorhynchus anatinus]
MELDKEEPEKPLPFTLRRFCISEDFGFLLPNPLTELPDDYRPWMEIASNLPQLIESCQLRARVDKMPLLSCQSLKSYREQHLAHLVLSFITMGYVWQGGEKNTVQVLPRNLALPFVEVSQSLGLPAILVHSDFVLVNWKKKNPDGPLEIGNLDTIVSLPGGDSLKGFILVTWLVEKAAVPGIKALVQAVNAILQSKEDSLCQAMQQLAGSIDEMTWALRQMHDYVDPAIFYAVIRIFLSGWKDNSAMPEGLIYEGISAEPLKYSGGSAAQSTALQVFDELLGIHHNKQSAAFLHRMRNYMPPLHKAFIEEIRAAPSLRQHILSSENSQLYGAYNKCVTALVELRTHHIIIVTKYIITAAANAKANRGKPDQQLGHLPGPPQSLEKRGTGGSGILSFLKSVRDTTKEAMINRGI